MKGSPPWGWVLCTVESSIRGLLDQGQCVRGSRAGYTGQSGYHYRESTFQASLEGSDGTGHQMLL